MSWIPTATLVVMMLALGMTLRAADFRRLLGSPAAVVFGVAGQLVVLPAAGFAIAHAFSLPHTLAVGLVLIAACPGGVTSNVLSWLARGDVALSISLTAVSSVVSFVTVPFLVSLALRVFGADGPPVTLSLVEMVTTLFGTTALPVLIGMAVLHVRPAWAARLHRPLLGASTSVLMLLIAGLAFNVSSSSRDLSDLLRRATPAVVLLVASTMAVGLAGARALGLGGPTARTLALEIGIQNFNLALVVAITILGNDRYVGPALVYLPVMFAFAGGVIVMGRRAAPDAVVAGAQIDA